MMPEEVQAPVDAHFDLPWFHHAGVGVRLSNDLISAEAPAVPWQKANKPWEVGELWQRETAI